MVKKWLRARSERDRRQSETKSEKMDETTSLDAI